VTPRAEKTDEKPAHANDGALLEDDDPTDQSLWRPFFSVIKKMDADIARLYSEREVTGITPRQVRPLILLAHRGPMTIREIALVINVTHSAASQTVTSLAKAGYVRSRPGKDARTRTVALTPKGRALVPLLEAEWRATDAAIAELESEITNKVSAAAREMEQVLARRSFYERITAHLSDGL
jgi:DNA-binding MarR family transcriptional regulator